MVTPSLALVKDDGRDHRNWWCWCRRSKTAADFDSAMSQVAAVSGATGKDFDDLRNKAREMGSKTKFSATEAAEAMNYMAMAG